MASNYTVCTGSTYSRTISPYATSIGCGTRTSSNTVAIGSGASATSSHSIAIGADVRTSDAYGIAIGTNTDQGTIMLNDVNIRNLKKKVDELEEIVKKQSELINALWFAPGMPGYAEGKEMWNKDSTSL